MTVPGQEKKALKKEEETIMKPCRKQNQAAVPTSTVQRSAAAPETNMRRYAHPIRTTASAARGSTEELLSYVLEALSRQSEQLDEVLRRLDGDNPDTM